MPEYVLVSQGIEIFRTKDKNEAEKIMKSGISMFRSVLIMVTLLQIMRFSYMRSKSCA